jgi:hypothetical protein
MKNPVNDAPQKVVWSLLKTEIQDFCFQKPQYRSFKATRSNDVQQKTANDGNFATLILQAFRRLSSKSSTPLTLPPLKLDPQYFVLRFDSDFRHAPKCHRKPIAFRLFAILKPSFKNCEATPPLRNLSAPKRRNTPWKS